MNKQTKDTIEEIVDKLDLEQAEYTSPDGVKGYLKRLIKELVEQVEREAREEKINQIIGITQSIIEVFNVIIKSKQLDDRLTTELVSGKEILSNLLENKQ